MTKIDVCRSLAAGLAEVLTAAFSILLLALPAADKPSPIENPQLQSLAMAIDSETFTWFRGGRGEWQDKGCPSLIG
ncbi:MAG: hypothetical protein OES20_04600 [Gammaproteobacteria bacterium]|nr:hypothetical protein [Gammaproteobacteria bacterium]MDH3857598.1 hypothetical protein [Gammaproteobacteria bacterium]